MRTYRRRGLIRMAIKDEDTPGMGNTGFGRSGWGIHAQALAGLSGQYAVGGVCDPDRDRQEEFRESYGCRACADDTDPIAVDEIEVIVGATPTQLQARKTKAPCSRAGVLSLRNQWARVCLKWETGIMPALPLRADRLPSAWRGGVPCPVARRREVLLKVLCHQKR